MISVFFSLFLAGPTVVPPCHGAEKHTDASSALTSSVRTRRQKRMCALGEDIADPHCSIRYRVFQSRNKSMAFCARLPLVHAPTLAQPFDQLVDGNTTGGAFQRLCRSTDRTFVTNLQCHDQPPDSRNKVALIRFAGMAICSQGLMIVSSR